jgi:D-apiose dehydrogenase
MIGAGYFAQFHAEAWRRIRSVEITAVADSSAARAQAFAKEHSIPRWYATADEMLSRESPDFVDIVTRPETHLVLTRQAAQRGAHVICQKPMVPTWEECLAMVEVCNAARVRLLIHENWRWQPWYREVHSLLNTGVLGKPFQFSFAWRTGDGRGSHPYESQAYFRQMPRLLVYESLIHILDTFRFLGGELSSVHCRTCRLNPAIVGEDCALISLAFRSGALGMIDGNRITGPVPAPVAMGAFWLRGDLAQVRMSGDGRLWLTEYGGLEKEHEFAIPSGGYKGDSVYATQSHLIDCIRSGRPCESEGSAYLGTMRAVFDCYGD